MDWACSSCGYEKGLARNLMLDPRYANDWCLRCKGVRTFMRRAAPRAIARNTDPETSHEAAISVSGIRVSQQHILDALRSYGPATDEEIFPRLPVPISPSGARTRRAELVAMGLVRDSGARRTTATGRKTIVWRAV